MLKHDFNDIINYSRLVCWECFPWTNNGLKLDRREQFIICYGEILIHILRLGLYSFSILDYRDFLSDSGLEMRKLNSFSILDNVTLRVIRDNLNEKS